MRLITTLLLEIASEKRLSVDLFANGWVVRLSRGSQSTFVFGYDFAVNNASAHMIARNKAVTAAVLNANNIPHVEHIATPKVRFEPWSQSRKLLYSFLANHESNIVCKPNEGSGGQHVYRVQSEAELETAALSIFSEYDAVCACPYLPLTAEHRVIVINGDARLMYTKVRPSRKTNGIAFNVDAAVDDRSALRTTIREPRLLRNGGADAQARLANWRHNLAGGAIAAPISNGTSLARELASLAVAGADALGISAAAVDICESPGFRGILEVNAGIMMDNYGIQSRTNRKRAKNIYYELVLAALRK